VVQFLAQACSRHWQRQCIRGERGAVLCLPRRRSWSIWAGRQPSAAPSPASDWCLCAQASGTGICRLGRVDCRVWPVKSGYPAICDLHHSKQTVDHPISRQSPRVRNLVGSYTWGMVGTLLALKRTGIHYRGRLFGERGGRSSWTERPGRRSRSRSRGISISCLVWGGGITFLVELMPVKY